MKEKGRRKRYVLAAIVILGLGWIYRPYESPDPNKLVPSLQGLQEPLLVKTTSWADGGSLGVFIQDDTGKLVMFCLPNPMDAEGDEYQRLFVGASHYEKEGAIEVSDSYHSKLRLLEILRNTPRKDMDRDRVIAIVSGRWRDWATFYIRRFKDDEYYDW